MFTKGVAGLLFGAVMLVIILVGVPAARQFLLISVPLGIVAALAIRAWHNRKPVEMEPENNKRPLGLD